MSSGISEAVEYKRCALQFLGNKRAGVVQTPKKSHQNLGRFCLAGALLTTYDNILSISLLHQLTKSVRCQSERVWRQVLCARALVILKDPGAVQLHIRERVDGNKHFRNSSEHEISLVTLTQYRKDQRLADEFAERGDRKIARPKPSRHRRNRGQETS